VIKGYTREGVRLTKDCNLLTYLIKRYTLLTTISYPFSC